MNKINVWWTIAYLTIFKVPPHKILINYKDRRVISQWRSLIDPQLKWPKWISFNKITDHLTKSCERKKTASILSYSFQKMHDVDVSQGNTKQNHLKDSLQNNGPVISKNVKVIKVRSWETAPEWRRLTKHDN